MKAITLALLGLWAITQSVSADVDVYKVKTTRTVTGGGTVVKTAYAGWTVISEDTTNAQVAVISVNVAAKQFSVEWPDSYQIDQIQGPLGKSYTVVTIDTPIDGFGTFTLKGLNTTLFTGGTFGTWITPKSFVFSGSPVFTEDTGTYLEELKGAAVIDLAATQTQNSLDGDIDNTVTRLTNQLLLLGYIEN